MNSEPLRMVRTKVEDCWDGSEPAIGTRQFCCVCLEVKAVVFTRRIQYAGADTTDVRKFHFCADDSPIKTEGL